MQLTRLLDRLSKEERRELLARRQVADAQGFDSRTLANQLAQPFALAPVFLELDNFQHLLLRWLASRTEHEAPWSALLDELRGRVPTEYLESEVRELRLWGLADYDPSPKKGFFATYPAAISVLPRGRRASLREALAQANSEALRQMLTTIGAKNPPTAKAARLGLLLSSLSRTDVCREVVAGLSEPARSIFDWVREQGGWVTYQQMASHPAARQSGVGLGMTLSYGSYWYGGGPPGVQHPVHELMRHGLLVVVSTSSSYVATWGDSSYVVPEEVELAYSGRSLFDSGALRPPELQRAEQASGVVPNPSHLLRDAVHLLGLLAAGRCEWRQDGQPYQRSLAALGKLLGNPDPSYPQALWSLCVAAGLVRPAGYGQTGFVPTDLAGAEPWRLFERLVRAWRDTGPANAPAVPSQQRTRLAREHLLQFLKVFPPDTWVLKASLEGALAFLWPMLFPLKRQDPLTDPDPGWAALRHLALAEGVTPDKQAAVMLPSALQALLAEEQARPSGALPPWDESWVVQADRSIIAPPNAHPEALLELWKVAQLEENQGAAVFRISSTSVAAALNRGASPKEVLELLQRRSRAPLPPTVERLVQDQAQRYGQIKLGAAQTYVRADDPALLYELQNSRKLHGLRWRELGPGVACILNVSPEGAMELLRRAGYLPVLDSAEQDGPDQASLAASGAAAPAAQGPKRVVQLCQRAMRDGALLALRWSEAGRVRQAVVEPLELEGSKLHAFCPETEEEIVLNLYTVLEASYRAPSSEESWA
ncbi:MAG: helicase-associated domain-containing protein [Chloroflexi bacterium]|nr:helicase-associated domain-containing protein [Chloroflexota bacterium]